MTLNARFVLKCALRTASPSVWAADALLLSAVAELLVTSVLQQTSHAKLVNKSCNNGRPQKCNVTLVIGYTTFDIISKKSI